MASDYDNYSPEQYDQLIANLGAAFQESSGFERQKLAAQIKDAGAARQNAMSIAKLQASTSIKVAQIGAQTQRYGIDVGRQNILDQLKENARQFDANHALDMERFGLDKQKHAETIREFDVNTGLEQEKIGLQRAGLNLDFAKTATDYLSSPDRYFQAGDYLNMASRAMNGLGNQPYGTWGTSGDTQVAPTPKTQADFAALAGYDLSGTSGAPAAGTPAAAAPAPAPAAAPAADGTPAPAAAPAATPGAAMPQVPGAVPANATANDPRLKALQAMFNAVPPSGDYGLNDDDWAVLNAAKSLMAARRPGTWERMRPGQQALTVSAGRRLGADPNDVIANLQSANLGQGSVRAA
jgi:hypothetical protein